VQSLSRARALALGSALLGALLASVVWSRQKTEQVLAAFHAQEAHDARDWSAVIEASTHLLDTPDSGDGVVHDALELRCNALAQVGRRDECFALLDERLGWTDAAHWTPALALVEQWAAGAEARGHRAEVLAVVERLVASQPGEARAAYLAYHTLRRSEPLAELAPRAIGWAGHLEPAHALHLRLLVANDQIRAHDEYSAVTTLGQAVPVGEPADVDDWWNLRIKAAAQLGDAAEARRLADQWGVNPQDRPSAEAALAVALSLAALLPVEGGDWLTPLLAAAENVEQVRGDDERVVLLRRLVGHAVVQGKFEVARYWVERAQVLDLSRVGDLDELQRLAQGEQVATAGGAQVGTLAFEVAGALPADVSLWVSPDAHKRVDGAWTELPLTERALTVQRAASATPVRWVLRSGEATYASGTTWVVAGTTINVPVEVRTPSPRAVETDLRPRSPPDGVRRIVVVILDSGDWRLAGYLRQRGEMPVLHALLAQGFRAPIVQYPAYTASAMAALTAPAAQTSAAFPAVVHQLGMELAGLASVGKNPFEPLAVLFPKNADIFTTLGGSDRRIANLLFSHGAVKAGRNAELVGPHGARSTVALGPFARALDEDELSRHPEWRGDGIERMHLDTSVNTTASQVDGVLRLVREGGAEIILYRLEALDIVTHGTFGVASEGGQDDGARALFSFYRYIDDRLGDLARAIDDDDMLIVMSDHGTLTSMQHDPVAMFVAWGNGVPQGIGQGLIRLGSVARLLATLEGVEVDWPGEDFAPWARAWHDGRTPPGLGVRWSGEASGG